MKWLLGMLLLKLMGVITGAFYTKYKKAEFSELTLFKWLLGSFVAFMWISLFLFVLVISIYSIYGVVNNIDDFVPAEHAFNSFEELGNITQIVIIITICVILIPISLFLSKWWNIDSKELADKAKMLSKDQGISTLEAARYLLAEHQSEKLENLKSQYEQLRFKPKLDSGIKEYFDRKIKQQEKKVIRFERIYNEIKNKRLGNKKITMEDYFEENNTFINNINSVNEFIRLTPREEQDLEERIMDNPNIEKVKLQAIEEFLTARQKITELISGEFLHKHGENLFNELKASLKNFHNARKQLEKIDYPERTVSEFPDIDFDNFD